MSKREEWIAQGLELMEQAKAKLEAAQEQHVDVYVDDAISAQVDAISYLRVGMTLARGEKL